MKKLNILAPNIQPLSTETDLLAMSDSFHSRLITRAQQLIREIAGINVQIYVLSMSGLREELVDEKINTFQRSLASLYEELERHENMMETAWS